MKGNIIASASITVNDSDVISISNCIYRNKALKDKGLKEKIKNILTNADIKYQLNPRYQCELQILDNKEVRIIKKQSIGAIQTEVTLQPDIKTALKAALHSHWILRGETPKTKKNLPKIKNISNSNIKSTENIPLQKKEGSKALKILLKVIDHIFVRKIYHAKGTDIAALFLFAFIVISIVISIAAPHLSIFHIAMKANYVSHIIFGAANTTVGLAVLTQSIKNFKKAKESQNKEEMILAIISMFYSFAIITTGFAAIANFSNNIILPLLFTVCAGFGGGIGTYNLTKTQLFRKRLKEKGLKIFLEEKIQISEEEYTTWQNKINKFNENEISEQLQKNLSAKEFATIQESEDFKSIDLKKEMLLNFELQKLQKRKIADLEKILRPEITQKAIDFVKNGSESDQNLEKEIYKELRNRTIADSFRIFATSLSIGGFSFTRLAHFDSEKLQNLAYYSNQFISRASGCWLNYFPEWRNVPADSKKVSKKTKTIFERMTKQPSLSATT